MAQVIMAKQFSKALDVDGSLQGPAWRFVGKLMEDHTTSRRMRRAPISDSSTSASRRSCEPAWRTISSAERLDLATHTRRLSAR